MKKRKRKSGIRENNENEEINFSSFTDPYEDFQQDYLRTLYAYRRRKKLVIQCYLISSLSFKDIFFIAFAGSEGKAKAKAVRYYRDQMHHAFVTMEDQWREYQQLRAHVFHQFDKYKDKEKVPIDELLKEGMNSSCSVCGNSNFTYHDVIAKRCFIIEGEGNPIPFVDGLVVCPNCYKKYFT